MTMKFLLHKDKEEKGKASPQKQECGCPSLQPSLRSHTHAFFPAHEGQDNNNGEGNHPEEPKLTNMVMDELCLRKLTEIRTLLENKKSELDLPKVSSISFEKEIELSESITNRCQDNELLAIRQKIENIIPDSDEILSSLNEIIDDINELTDNENKSI